MKVLAIFMSVFVLLTGFSGFECEANCETIIAVQKGNTGDDQFPDENPCEYFCNCSVSACSVADSSTKLLIADSSLEIKQGGWVFPSVLTKISSAVWQPPK